MYKSENYVNFIYYYNVNNAQLATPNIEIAVRRNMVGDIQVETITGKKSEMTILDIN